MIVSTEEHNKPKLLRRHGAIFEHRRGLLVLCLVCLFDLHISEAADPHYPVAPGTLEQVACTRYPSIIYDIYLPTAYGQGTDLPILITQSPSGGGMAPDFKSAGEALSCIIIGNRLSKNGLSRAQYDAYSYPMMLDIQERVDFDPTAMYAGGFSGGAWESFEVTQERRQHMAGVLSMGGWMGDQYNSHDRYLSGLLVARVTGDSDFGALSQAYQDLFYLNDYGAIVRDWSFVGGHAIGPASVRQDALEWLITNRVYAVEGDADNAEAQAAQWRAELESGNNDGAVFCSCVQVLLDHPRSYLAFEAENIIDSLMADYGTFQFLDLSTMPGGDLVSDYFTYKAHWCHVDERNRYYSGVRAFRSIPFSIGDRIDYVNSLVNDYPAPLASITVDTSHGYAPLVVGYTGTNSSSIVESTLSYEWDFGDGGTALGPNGNYTFVTPGSYTVKLTVTDSAARKHTKTEIIEVLNSLPDVTSWWDGVVENDSTTLWGTILRPGINTPETYICWGDQDSATSMSEWQHVEHTGISSSNFFTVVPLDSNQRYFFRALASNDGGTQWAPSSVCMGWTEPVPIPFSESFDSLTPWMSSTLGPIKYQHGWSSKYDKSNVVKTDNTNQVCRIASDEIAIDFLPGGTNVWLEMKVQMIVNEYDPNDPRAVNASALLWLSLDEKLCAMDGHNVIEFQSVSITNRQWVTLLANMDYGSKQWTLWLDGQMVKEGIEFFSPYNESLKRLSIVNDSPGACDIDTITVGLNRPTPNAIYDVDADGLPDSWELRYSPRLSELHSGQSDYDGDGLYDALELRCGTNPFDEYSCFGLSSIAKVSQRSVVILWDTQMGKFYDIEYTESLKQAWTTLESRVEATPPMNTYTSSTGQAASGFYRIKLAE